MWSERAAPDLLQLIGQDTRLRRTSGTRGGEYHGACVFCGGSDRFFVQPHNDAGFWYCRRCNPKGSDAAGYIMAREGVTRGQAVARLSEGLVPQRRPTAPPRQESDHPDDAWRAHAERLIARAADCLWSPTGRHALSWLEGRGLSDATITAARLGYIPADGRDGSWRVCRAIVIPVLGVDQALYGIRLRLPVPQDARGTKKYTSIVGSRNALYGTLRGHDTLMVVEGYFDCLLAAQELVGHPIDVATMNLCRPAGRWLRYLLGYRHILVALDSDQAGRDGWAHWSWIGSARQVQLPAGKDASDAIVHHGVDLAAWVAGTMEPPVPGPSANRQAAPIVHAEADDNNSVAVAKRALPLSAAQTASIPRCEDRWMLYNDERAF